MKVEKKKDLISVIIPVYNTVRYLERCIESLLKQTYKNIQIILINDGSDDGSAEICDKYARDNDNVIVVHTKNLGSSAARNLGLKYVLGEYIGFIDSDDYISMDFYECMMKYMIYDVDVVSCGVNVVHTEGKMMRQCTPKNVLTFSGDEIVKNLLETSYINFSMCNKVFRKRRLDNISFPVGKNHEDIPVMYQIAKGCSKIVCINKAKYFYFVRNGSNSRKPFNIGNLYLAISTRDIYMDVKKHYSQYKDVALNRYLEYVMYLIDLINNGKNDRYIKVRMKLEKEIRYYTINILRNSYMDSNLKARLLGTAWESKVDIIKKWNENSDKYLTSTRLFDKWFEKKQKGKQIVWYFKEKNICSIAIYGMSYLGQRLNEELKNSSVNVKYVIDKNAKEIFSDVKLITPTDDMELVDAIVVTATYYYDEIRSFLVNKVQYKIISLEDIINEM